MNEPLDLDAIRAKYEQAHCNTCQGHGWINVAGVTEDGAECHGGRKPCPNCNGRIFPLPPDIAALIAECERLRAEVARLTPKPVCSLCHGTGRITKTDGGDHWCSVMTLPCPAGCPPLMPVASTSDTHGVHP